MELDRKEFESSVALVEELFKAIKELKGPAALESARRNLRREVGDYSLVCHDEKKIPEMTATLQKVINVLGGEVRRT